ncbi:MAG: hypothetical protein ABSE06_11775 [Anaerolineaceae bacterium]
MERTVPSTASEEIELYLRTVYSLLRSTTEVQVRTLEEVHMGLNSTLHMDARSQTPDVSAFVYSSLRLPQCITRVQSVIMGQSSEVFNRHGFDVESWQPMAARARRRRCYFNGEDTLACFIASRSDIDDLIPSLTAFQIEWNKMNRLLQNCPESLLSAGADGNLSKFAELSRRLEMSQDDLARLKVIWGDEFLAYLQQIAHVHCSFSFRLLDGSLIEYWRATRVWWDNIESLFPQLSERPIYFISSNTHSVTNLLSGFALKFQKEVVAYLNRNGDRDLLKEWHDIQNRQTSSNQGNFLYYALKKFQQVDEGKFLVGDQLNYEKQVGILRIPSIHSFDVDAQVIELSRLDPATIDPRLSDETCNFLSRSDALIINIDYPLGFSAYNILTKVAEHAGPILGVYVMGKAATLNGVHGDVIIPNVVYDEHSQNTYLFQNAFMAADVAPYLVYGTVLDNQKAVSVLGTFLQNLRIMDVIYREGYTDIEMEAGPYLSAVYEMYRPKRHPVNEIVNLYGVPFDLGILHYASDKPLSKGKNLGAGTLSYFGMDSTYAATVAILRRIMDKECKRLAS